MQPQARLTITADVANVAMARAATAAICTQADFTIDALEDLRLAIDEACALAIADAPPGSELQISWERRGHHVTVEVVSPSRSGTPIPRDGFAWTVLTALVDDVTADLVDGVHLITLRAQGLEPVAP